MNNDNVYIPFPLPELPRIPDATFDICAFGAQNRGTTPNTRAIAATIEAAHAAGGGRVIIPAGIWLTGPIHLRSRIELHLEEGAEVRFSQTPEDYLPVVLIQRGGVWCYNYSPFIYARDCHDIAVTGSGAFNGQGRVLVAVEKGPVGHERPVSGQRRPATGRAAGVRHPRGRRASAHAPVHQRGKSPAGRSDLPRQSLLDRTPRVLPGAYDARPAGFKS